MEGNLAIANFDESDVFVTPDVETGSDDSMDYLPVKVRDLMSEDVLPFDIFLPDIGQGETTSWKRVVASGKPLRREFHDTLRSRGITVVYVSRTAHEHLRTYLTRMLDRATLDSGISVREKIELICDALEHIIRVAILERPTPASITNGRQYVEYLSVLMANAPTLKAEAIHEAFSRDCDSVTHSVQVAVLGMCFCKFLGWESDTITDWGLGALFHDIGRDNVKERILESWSRRHSTEELELLKKHTTVGYLRLKSAEILSEDQLQIVLHHHEAMDGSGYPDGLSGARIHEYARIARIVDCFDILCNTDSSEPALSAGQAIEAMRDGMKPVFDARLLESFIDFMGMGDAPHGRAHGKRISIELGSELLVQLDDEDVRFKTALVGMDLDKYLILRSPDPLHIRNQMYEGRGVIVRCIHSGNVYGFRSSILCHVLHPALRLLVLSYPKRIEAINLRKHPRVICHLPAEAISDGTTFPCVIIDLSMGGCMLMGKRTGENGMPGLQVDQRIVLRAQLLGDGTSDTLSGLVRNVRMDGEKITLGVKFEGLEAGASQSLSSFLENILSVMA